MPRKKKTEEVVEEVKVTEEKPKKTTAKKTTKKTTEKKVEKVEEPIVLTDVKVVESPALSIGDKAVVTAKSGTNIFKGPGLSYANIGSLNNGAKVIISDISGNFACIGANKWININFISKV